MICPYCRQPIPDPLVPHWCPAGAARRAQRASTPKNPPLWLYPFAALAAIVLLAAGVVCVLVALAAGLNALGDVLRLLGGP